MADWGEPTTVRLMAGEHAVFDGQSKEKEKEGKGGGTRSKGNRR
jgi:hypothetical protein